MDKQPVLVAFLFADEDDAKRLKALAEEKFHHGTLIAQGTYAAVIEQLSVFDRKRGGR